MVPAPAELLRSPLACAFLLIAADNGLPAGELCRPPVAAALAADAAILLNPWTSHAPAARAELLGRAGEVAGLAAEVLADPRAASWWAPAGTVQAYLDPAGGRPRPDPPAGPPAAADQDGSAYAQLPGWGFVTSTPWPGGSGLHAAVAACVGDLAPRYPLARAEVTVAPHARVYEIRTAADWRALALAHPHRRPAGDGAMDPPGLAGDLVPDWASVAAQWDGVHLGLGGLLAGLLVPLGPSGDRSVLWTWDFERTVWLRAPFTEVTDLPPLTDAPSPALGAFRYPELRASD